MRASPGRDVQLQWRPALGLELHDPAIDLARMVRPQLPAGNLAAYVVDRNDERRDALLRRREPELTELRLSVGADITALTRNLRAHRTGRQVLDVLVDKPHSKRVLLSRHRRRPSVSRRQSSPGRVQGTEIC